MDAERAEVEIRLSGSNQVQRYRLESVNISENTDLNTVLSERVERLQNYISSYSGNWELIQILDAGKDAKYIHLLYREKI